MYTSCARLQWSTRPRHHVGTRQSVQPTSPCEIGFLSFTSQIKRCAVSSLPLLFSSFPCKITVPNPILPRLSQRDAMPQIPFGRLDTLFLDGPFARELRTSNELA